MSAAGDGNRAAVGTQRQRLPFRAVNRRDSPGHEPGLQRHHILPRQLLSRACFTPMLAHLGQERLGFDDFRLNGLLLPANDHTALAIGADNLRLVDLRDRGRGDRRPEADEMAFEFAAERLLDSPPRFRHGKRR